MRKLLLALLLVTTIGYAQEKPPIVIHSPVLASYIDYAPKSRVYFYCYLNPDTSKENTVLQNFIKPEGQNSVRAEIRVVGPCWGI